MRDPDQCPYSRGGHQEGYGETFRHILREFYADLLGVENPDGRGDYPTLADGTAEMVLCEAIIESMENNRWVDIASE